MKVPNLSGIAFKIISLADGSNVVIAGRWIYTPGQGSGSGSGGGSGSGSGGEPMSGAGSGAEVSEGNGSDTEMTSEAPIEAESVGEEEQGMSVPVRVRLTMKRPEKSEEADSDAEGETWEMAENPAEDQETYGGGGAQATGLTASVVRKDIRDLFSMFLSSFEDLFRKKMGSERWDTQKFVEAAIFRPHLLADARYTRPKSEETVLFIDVSGSVSYLSKFIVDFITTASKNRAVKVVVGGEAHPMRLIDPKDFLTGENHWWSCKATWEQKYKRDFAESCFAFFRENRVPHGLTIVIWSDYMDIHCDDLKRLFRILKPYNVVWLCSHTGKDYHSMYQSFDTESGEQMVYAGNESYKMEAYARKHAEPFLWGIDSVDGVKKAIKRHRRK